MSGLSRRRWTRRAAAVAWCGFLTVAAAAMQAEEPPALNPFGPGPTQVERDDVYPGYIEMSDGTVYAGDLFLTRDIRLKVYDKAMQRQREIPLRAIKQIECKVKKEWMEKEWRFKELALDEKYYTGREYPAREYEHVITLHDDRTITGDVSGIVYLKQKADYDPAKPGLYRPEVKQEQFVLHKRDKGEPGTDLKSLKYIRRIELGDDAYQEGLRKTGRRSPRSSK